MLLIKQSTVVRDFFLLATISASSSVCFQQDHDVDGLLGK